ncbi:MAG: AMP-binding protein [Actinomycetota bacterium]|nr:AMP-binding protein [Actinomycetota bacterium]
MTDILPHDWAKIHAGANPDAPAIVSADASISYGDLDRRADQHAERLVAGGVAVGDIVPFPAASTPETIVAMIAIPRAGAAMAPYGPHRVDGDEAPSSSTYAVVATSGNSGHPRGVVLTKRNVEAAVEASQERLGNGPSDRWLLTLPLFHVGGISIVWRSLTAGGSIELHPRFDAAATAAALRSRPVTMASFVPTMLHRVLEYDPGPYDGLKAVLLGGAPASTDLVYRALSSGLPVLQTYGMTETCSQVSTVVPGTAHDASGTAGPPLDGFVVSLDEGEILVDGPAVSPGYVGEAPRSGAHRTGDRGRIDEAGRLIITGRRDELIITGGENVQPSAVEALIEALPEVAFAVVVGVDDEEWGQIVVAVVELEFGGIADIEAAAANRLARHEIPKHWIAVDRIPLLPTGKPDHQAAKGLAAAVLSSGSR